jgi:hypothetical protein
MEIRTLITRGFDMWSPQIITTTVSGGGAFGIGSIQLENGWQQIAAPVQFGWWSSTIHSHINDGVTVAKFKNYILDQITDLYGDIVEIANCFTGDAQQFYTFIPGSTPESSFNNFNLVYNDDNHMEITGFWIKIVGDSGPYIISWGQN